MTSTTTRLRFEVSIKVGETYDVLDHYRTLREANTAARHTMFASDSISEAIVFNTMARFYQVEKWTWYRDGRHLLARIETRKP